MMSVGVGDDGKQGCTDEEGEERGELLLLISVSNNIFGIRSLSKSDKESV